MRLADLLKTDIDSVQLKMDDKGHTRVLFSESELEKINSTLKSQMDSVYQDWTPIWNESVENMETYRTVKIAIPDGGQSIYPAPIARIPADQVIASVYNAIMRPRPIFSIDAYLDAQYSVPNAQMGPSQVQVEQQNAETCAHRMEQGYDFVVRERIQIGPKLLRGIRGAVCGSPFWWKVVADPQQHTSLAARSGGAIIDLNDKYEETRLRGDMVKWYLVPFTNCMYPLDAESIDSAPWFAERNPMRPDELAKRYAAGELFLIKDDTECASLVSNTIDQRDEFRSRAAASTERKVPSAPIQVCDNWINWFFWDVNYVDPQAPSLDGKTRKKTKRLSLIGNFQRTTGKLMSCHLNDYEHQCRPYELVDQMDEGDCTVARLKYHQTMFTYGAQAEIKSAHIANNLLFWHDPNITEVADFFASHKVLSLGDHIPGIKDKEWGTAAAGEKHYSMLELLKFFLSMSQLDSRENDFTMGGRPPGRTPMGTVTQVYQHAEEVKTMFLARLSIKLSRLLRLDAETRRQYQPLGEVLPMWDAEAKQTIEIPFRFPVGDVLDNFRIALTASDEQLKEEHDPQQVMLRKQALMADGEYVAKIVAAIVNLQQPLPPEGVAVFEKIIDRDQEMMRDLMGETVADEEKYDLRPEIKALIAARNQALIALQQQPPTPQQPQQPQTKINVSLSGKLTPEQEAAAATMQGIGGMNAQGSVATGQAGAGQSPGQGSGGPATPAAPVQRPVQVPAPQVAAAAPPTPAGPVQ